MKLTEQDFENLSKYIHNICGIALKEQKAYLIRHRLEPVVISAGCQSFEEFYQKLSTEDSANIRDIIIEAIATNETYFFRDGHPFEEFYKNIMPELVRLIMERKCRGLTRKGNKARIWSAGASTGQEPYSIAMEIHEYITSNPSCGCSCEDIGILATDISSTALAKAISGTYNKMEVSRGLSSDRKSTYFWKKGTAWVIHDWIKKMVNFQRINFIEPFAVLGSFDIIFCRNVLIYFNNETKRAILEQFHRLLNENGLLILGASENLYDLFDGFESVGYGGTTFYRKKS